MINVFIKVLKKSSGTIEMYIFALLKKYTLT